MKRYFMIITFIIVSLLTGCGADLTESECTDGTFDVLLENDMNSLATHIEEYNGFQLSTFDSGEGVLIYTYEYYDTAVDLSIRMNNDGLYSTIYHNGKKLDINTYGHFYDNGSNGYALPYLIDVTGDGQEELILEYASPDPSGVPYLIHKCYVYRLDTMKQILFNTDTTELSKLIIFTPKSFNKETNELTLQVEFDESIHSNLIPSDRTPYETTITITPSQADYWTQTHYAYLPNMYDSLDFKEDSLNFTAEFLVYLDDTMTYNRFYPFYVDYIWDEASSSFIMNLSTAHIPAAG